MRYINKGEEPQRFTDWKGMENEDWKPSWDELRAPEKPDVHEALLREQGFICCYCGMRINRETSHIEHLKPRTTYPEIALEYGNLLASCQGESEEPPLEPVHCGHKKGKWYEAHLMVSPLDANCANFFRYAGSGEILPTDEPDKQAVAITTIEKLGLDIDKLRAMRSAAIDGVLMAIEGLTDEEILLFVQAYEQLDADGRYTPFCDAIAYILKQYFIA